MARIAWEQGDQADSVPFARFIKQFGVRAARGGHGAHPNLAEGKIGLAVQFVSNCHSSSRREFYVRELQKGTYLHDVLYILEFLYPPPLCPHFS